MTLRFVRGMRGRCLTVGVGVAIVIAAGCSDIPSDPKTPFAIEFNRAPAPGVVLGDTLFDSLGTTAPLRAKVYNSKGDVIEGAPITYHVVPDDTVPLTVNASSGFVLGKPDSVYAGRTARVYAQSGGLQSGTVLITATPRPNRLVAVGAVEDSITLRFSNVDSLTVAPGPTVGLRDTLGRTATGNAVPAYLVRFRIIKPAGGDTSYVMLTNGDRKRSELDTTDASGNASRQIRIRRVNFPFANPADSNGTIYDTVVVRSSAVTRDGARVAGRDSLFRLIIKAHKP